MRNEIISYCRADLDRCLDITMIFGGRAISGCESRPEIRVCAVSRAAGRRQRLPRPACRWARTAQAQKWSDNPERAAACAAASEDGTTPAAGSPKRIVQLRIGKRPRKASTEDVRAGPPMCIFAYISATYVERGG